MLTTIQRKNYGLHRAMYFFPICGNRNVVFVIDFVICASCIFLLPILTDRLFASIVYVCVYALSMIATTIDTMVQCAFVRKTFRYERHQG